MQVEQHESTVWRPAKARENKNKIPAQIPGRPRRNVPDPVAALIERTAILLGLARGELAHVKTVQAWCSGRRRIPLWAINALRARLRPYVEVAAQLDELARARELEGVPWKPGDPAKPAGTL